LGPTLRTLPRILSPCVHQVVCELVAQQACREVACTHVARGGCVPQHQRKQGTCGVELHIRVMLCMCLWGVAHAQQSNEAEQSIQGKPHRCCHSGRLTLRSAPLAAGRGLGMQVVTGQALTRHRHEAHHDMRVVDGHVVVGLGMVALMDGPACVPKCDTVRAPSINRCKDKA
jgi:hypothetical protein